MYRIRRRRTAVRTLAFSVAALIAAALTTVPLSGCARDGSDRMDTAMKAGAKAGNKAAAYKKGAQSRVDEATAITGGR